MATGDLARSFRYRLGLPVVTRSLADGDRIAFIRHYDGRVSHCEFLGDPDHYEYPRARFVTSLVSGGCLLEIGCGNGGMTRLLSPLVDSVVALDVSSASIAELERLKLPNVSACVGLIEEFWPEDSFKWIVLSEVIEHVQSPQVVLERCISLLAPSGRLVITTPNGHWESDEHLREWSMRSLSDALSTQAPAEFTVRYICDNQGRRRWLGAVLSMPEYPPTSDRFFDRKTIRRQRRLNRRGKSDVLA